MDCQNHIIPVPALNFLCLNSVFRGAQDLPEFEKAGKPQSETAPPLKRGRITASVSSWQRCQQLHSHNLAGGLGAGTDTQIAV